MVKLSSVFFHCCLHAFCLPVSLTDIWQVSALCSEWQQTQAATLLFQKFHYCRLMLLPSLTLRCHTARHFVKASAWTFLLIGQNLFKVHTLPLLTMFVLILDGKIVCSPWVNVCVTAVVLLLHKALHSQSHCAYNSSQWVGDASFKPWRKSSYLPTPPPFLSLTHRHGQGPIREGCSIQYASPIALQHKQVEPYLSNVEQQCSREELEKMSGAHL